MNKKTVKYGIIGCGVISDWHARAISEIENAEFLGVTDVVEAARKSFAEKYGVKAYDTVDALVADPELDTVCICTPSGLHAPLAIRAANAGKHIVVEKPMAITETEIKDVLDACEKRNVKMSVVSQLRFTRAVSETKKAVDDGALGKIVIADLSMKYFRSQEYYDKGGWRGTWKMDGGGALMNQGIHGIDIMQYIMGPVKSVSAFTRTLARKIEVEDTAVAILEFENGALGKIVGTTSVYPGSARRLEICGDRGMITLEENKITCWEVEGRDLPEDLKDKGSSSGTHNDPTSFDISGHVMQLTDMTDAIISGRMPAINQFDGKKPVEIILAIYESAETGKTVML
ncbi:MAG: Gfo/Idh/MocA family oxidoreductase [Clostridiales bacterium]|nr:Gfo/Idh/MocA family oxidoreductase [Clostridiales bacterium]